jgi:hypothetical protein
VRLCTRETVHAQDVQLRLENGTVERLQTDEFEGVRVEGSAHPPLSETRLEHDHLMAADDSLSNLAHLSLFQRLPVERRQQDRSHTPR